MYSLQPKSQSLKNDLGVGKRGDSVHQRRQPQAAKKYGQGLRIELELNNTGLESH